MIKSIIFKIFLIVIVLSGDSFAKTVGDVDIRNSVLANYPLILSAYDKVESSQGKVKSAQGIFDIRLKQEFFNYSRGFYDGRISKTTIERQNQFLGSKVYGGYRKSSDDFASYDGNYNTNKNGEFFAGVNIPLLQGRSIDQNRLGTMLAQYGFEESKINLENIKIKIQKDALKAYWNWISAAKTYEIYKDLYQLSLTRDTQLRKRQKKGDIAKIIVIENKKNLLTRKNDMIRARTDFQNSAIYLSLFYRDLDGKQLKLEKENIPKISFNTSLDGFSNSNLVNDTIEAVNNRAEIKILRVNKLKQKANLKYAKNLFQPKLDVSLEASKDSGSGPDSLTQSRNSVGMKLSIPLQFSQARGKTTEAIKKLSSLSYEEKIIQEQIKTEMQQIHISIINDAEMLNNLKEEVLLAETLERAERKRFRFGSSNFFVVNLREQISANTKIRKIIAWQKLQNFKADYNAARFRFN